MIVDAKVKHKLCVSQSFTSFHISQKNPLMKGNKQISEENAVKDSIGSSANHPILKGKVSLDTWACIL